MASTTAAATPFRLVSRWLLVTARVCVYLLARELTFDANPSFPFSFLSRISDQLCVNIQSVALGFPYSFMVLPIT